MRSYKEIADRVLERRDEYLAEKKKKRAALIRGISATAGTGLMLMVGIGLWQNSDIRKAAPSQHDNQYIITEYTTEDAPYTTSPDITGTEAVSTDIVTTVTEPASESASSPASSSKGEIVTTTTASSTSTTPASTPENTDVPASTSTSTGTTRSGSSASGTSSNVRTTTSVVTTGRSTVTTTHTTRRTTSASTTTTKQTTTAATTTSPRTSPTTTQHQTTTTTNTTHPYNTTTITQTTTRYYTYATSTEWLTTTTTTATHIWYTYATTTTTTTTVTTIWYTSTLATNVTTPPDEIYTWFYYDGYRYDIEDHYEMVNSALDVAAPIGHVDPDVRPDPYTGLLVPNSIDVYKIPNVDPYYAIAIKFTENWERRGHLLAYRNSYRIGEPPDTFNDLIDGLGLTTEAAGFTATLEDGTSKYYDKYKLQQILEIIQNAGKSDEYIWNCPLIISISTRYTKSPIILRIDEEHIYAQAFSGYAFSITPEQYRQILEVLNTT